MKPFKELPFIFVIIAMVYGCSLSRSEDSVEDSVPHWSETAVWYSIFPERFNNADRSNDPNADRVLNGADFTNWKVTAWTSNWFEPDEWMKTPKTEHLESETAYRRYGGDLQGVLNELDYLHALGITAIWFNPVFDAQSLHKYEASSYHHIDRFFGPNPTLDVELMELENPADPSTWLWTSADSLFLKLIDEIHKRDMKIIIDGVFNHTGRDFWAFKDILENGEKSVYKNWYEINQFDNPTTTDTNEFDYEGWWGISALPVLKEHKKGLVKDVKQHIYSITKRWMDPNNDGNPIDGVDGWRLDVAEEVATPFWVEWNEFVHHINPDAYTTAETWSTEAYSFMEEAGFDGVMNYQYAFLANEFFVNQSINAVEYAQKLVALVNATPQNHRYKVQNLFDSHDTPRIVSMLESPVKEYDRNASPKEGFKTQKPSVQSYMKLKTMMLHLMCSPGAPLIYYGTEAGMWGADDPHNRKPMVWPGLAYEAEINYAQAAKRDINSFDYELYNFIQSVILLREENQALLVGELTINQEFTFDDAILSYQRVLNKNQILVVINPTSSLHSIKVNNNWELLFELNMGDFTFNQDSTIELPEYSAIVLKKF